MPKHARRFTAFDDSIVALYARGMTVREIQGYLAEAYGTEVGHDLISTVTDGVLAEVTAWQARPLEPVYAVVFFDALRVKTREDNVVRNKAVYLALGVRRDGTREVLGLWIETTEGAKFWMKVFNDLKHPWRQRHPDRGDRRTEGMPAALAVVFPKTTLQTCIVHLIRNSLDYASWKDRKPLAATLRPILCGSQCRSGGGGVGCVRGGRMGTEVPDCRCRMAPRCWRNKLRLSPVDRGFLFASPGVASRSYRSARASKSARISAEADRCAMSLSSAALLRYSSDLGDLSSRINHRMETPPHTDKSKSCGCARVGKQR